MRQFYIFTNSPGEVFAWAQPLCERLSQEFDSIDIYIFLTPCQYATGEEARVAAAFSGVTRVFHPKETVKMLLFKSLDFKPGTVFFMGGDPFHSKRFASRTKSHLVGYFDYSSANMDGFDYVFSKSKTLDLMAANITPSPIYDRKGLVLLPGSRPEHLEVALPLMLKISDSFDDVTVMVSPFTSSDQLTQFKQRYSHIEFIRMNHVNDLSFFKFALTIPGTNTMQLAYLQIPFLMILPTHDSRILRLDGLIGLMLNIPIIGPVLKYIILNLRVSSRHLYSLPNLALGYQVCPELVGRFSIEAAKLALSDISNNEKNYHQMVNDLKQLKVGENALDGVIEFLNGVS